MNFRNYFHGVIIISSILLLSCTTITYELGSLNGFASLNSASNEDYDVVGHFEYTTRSTFAIASLITLKNPEITNAMSRAISEHQADGIVNVKIEEITDFVDFLIGFAQSIFIGVSIFNTRHVEITGDVVKLKPKSSASIQSFESQMIAAIKKNGNEIEKIE